MTNKKYIVYKNYTFGTNYLDKSGRIFPDYTLQENKQEIPTMNESTAKMLIARNPYYTMKEIEQ